MRTFAARPTAGLFTAAGLCVAALAVAACGGDPNPREQLAPQNRVAENYDDALNIELDSMRMRFNGLHVQDLEEGDGVRADSGDVVTVHYTGWLPNGTQFDSSRDRGEPFQVALGYGRVIAGWDQGIVGMRVGGRRLLVIPPGLAYGTSRRGPIPANSTLVFDVELLEVENRTPEG